MFQLIFILCCAAILGSVFFTVYALWPYSIALLILYALGAFVCYAASFGRW